MSLDAADRPVPRWGPARLLARLRFCVVALWLGGFLQYLDTVRQLIQQVTDR